MAAVLPVLAGCSALSALGDATKALDVYELQVPAALPVARGPLAREVVVELPSTGGALETDRIMIRPSPLQAEYLPGARWSDPTPVMLQTLMLRTLNDSQGLRYVGRRPLGTSGDYAIVTELTEFQAVATDGGKGATIRLQMTARLVRESDAAIVATRTFRASAAADSTKTLPLVQAFDRAGQQMMLDFARWTMSSLGRPLPTG